MATKDTFLDIVSDLVIPDYKDLHAPFSQWEELRSIELLEANGFENARDAWRRAAINKNGLLRGTARYLLTRDVEASDADLLRGGLSDIDETARCLSAYGLYRLGDASFLDTIRQLSRLDPEAHAVSTRAAGILGQAGEATAFEIIEQAMRSKQEHVQIFAMQNVPFFVPLHRKSYNDKHRIDIWSFYQRALEKKSSYVHAIAVAQLEELGESTEAKSLLSKYREGLKPTK